MKKFIKWTAIIVGGILALILIGIVALPFVFPLEKIKDFAVAKISESINREVKIEQVSFAIFSGIKLEKLSVSNRKGFSSKPFVSADAIDLRYAFWPLFSRQIIVNEVRLVKPEILIEKNVRGEFNFSDLVQPKRTPSTGKKTKLPFSLLVSSFSIRDGKIVYSDYSAKTKNEIKNLNVRVSGFELALVKPIDAKMSANMVYQGKEIPLSLTGSVGINMAEETIEITPLSLSIAGERALASASISNWKQSPHVDFAVQTQKLSVDPLLAIFAAPAKKPKPKPGELTKTIDQAMAAIPKNLSLNGKIDVANLTFQKFKVDRLNLILALSKKKLSADIKEAKIYNGILSGKVAADLTLTGLGYNATNLKLAGFNASPFANAMVETFLTNLPDYKDLVNKVFGTLDASLSLKGRGVEPQDILKNAVGEGSFSIKEGELKRIKTLASVGQTIKSNTLQQDIKFGDLNSAFSIKDQIISVKDLKLDNPDIKVSFNGGVDLRKLAWVPGNRLGLKLHPSLTKDLPKEFTVFLDEKGWLELTFEIAGELKKPIPKPILEKPIEKAVGKVKLKIEAKKIEIEQKAKEELRQKEEEAKKSLEEEAKKKVKEIFKF